jgi:uncharacterized protein with HEPN domain
MQRDPRAFLWDAREAARDIQCFTQGMNVDAFVASALVQAAVERKFEVIGEALNQLGKMAPLWRRRFLIFLKWSPSETS